MMALLLAVLGVESCGRPHTCSQTVYNDYSHDEARLTYHVEHYPSGRRRAEGAWGISSKEGLWLYWHENGQLESKGVYEQGKEIGFWIGWFESGALSCAGYFVEAKKHGPWVSHAPGGNFAREESGYYENGDRIRELTTLELEQMEHTVTRSQ